MREELKSVQRVFKTGSSLQQNQCIIKREYPFCTKHCCFRRNPLCQRNSPKAGIELKEAKDIFHRAERTNTAAMLIVGELQDTMRAMDVSAIETTSLSKKLEAVSKDFPNLKSLFKLTDTCACEHCHSVYSPAAYLVEILQF